MNGQRSKTINAYESLKTLLREGLIDKNRIIPTNELAELVSMGRAPVLEALKKLELERHVIIIPQKGVMVREMTVQEMREINDVRIALEGFMAMKIAPGFSDEDSAYIRELLKEQSAAEKADDPRRFIKSDEEFHMYLCEKSGNSLFISIMQQLRERSFTAGLYILMRPDRMKSTLEEHNRIFRALVARDADAAGREMIAHIESGKSRLV
ncbi:MAG: GntR family transcriptional regulator [Synergistaceae bacterium]|nr:GntR family transcriptional regulator [Synergistaceae bacterium]